jgi:hypothetical protein
MAAKPSRNPLYQAVTHNDYDLCVKLSEGEEGMRRVREEAAFLKVRTAYAILSI